MKIQAFFDSLKKANNTIEALKRAGFENATLDLKDEKIGEQNMLTNSPGTSTSNSLSDLVLEGGDRDIDIEKAPLTAADPMASGMAGFDEIADFSHKIVIDIDKNNIADVKKIITLMGGELNES